MMSAGRNENVTPGNRAGSSSRRVRTYSAVGRWFSFSPIWISPSCDPIVPVLLYVMLMPLTDMPMLSTNVSTSSGGIICRTTFSISAN